LIVIGEVVDLSEEMLEKAEGYASERGVNNLSFMKQDLTDLSSFDNQSVDAVVSTVTLHYLHDFASLEKTFSEIERVLKKDGGLLSIQRFLYHLMSL
jgi:ubiquinone/menaquinone biosynthesis C-methylase UbiE